MMKRNEGFTLVELLVAIVVGTLVTAAASTLLLMGLRINKRSADLAVQQNATRMLLEVMGEVVAEEGYRLDTDGNGWTITGAEADDKVVSFHDNAIYLRNTELLEEVAASEAKVEASNSKLLTITITMEDGKDYTSTIYCRFLGENPPENASSLSNAYTQGNYADVLKAALEAEENSPPVKEFLNVLASQYGSRGQILNEAGTGTGEYFSEWYIGSYEDNPGWDEDTPWCACYLSWAADRCEGLWEVPRYANVDTWWSDVITERAWTPSDPSVGDIVFFDWIVDSERNPQHVGAVLAVSDGWLYTIEGNSGNRVTLCRYEADDPCILGYAKLDWK